MWLGQVDPAMRIGLLILGVIVLFPLSMMGGSGLSPLWGIGMMLWLLILVGVGYFLFRSLVDSHWTIEDVDGGDDSTGFRD